MPPRVHIIGGKNSGKTTLVVELIEYYCSQGRRVGSVKHTHHHHELDTPGKDSFLHRKAGAAVVGILSPGMNAAFWPPEDEHDSEKQYDKLGPMYEGCDLVLVEGHSRTAGAKIEVWRAANGNTPLAASDSSILAVVTDDPLDLPVPQWSRSDVATLAGRLLEIGDS